MFSSKRLKLLVLVLSLVMLLSAAQLVSAQGPAESLTLVSFDVNYGGKAYDSATDQTTFTYIVTGTGNPPDLSHFDLEVPTCSPPLLVVGYSPTDAVSFGVDPTTGVDGIKWDLPLKTSESRTYTLTFDGNVVEGAVQVAVKGDTAEVGTITGPSCVVASIDVEKAISSDGTTWVDAADAPGPELEVGSQVWFRFIVTNIGNVPLTNLTLSDNIYGAPNCENPFPETLEPAVSFTCVIGPFDVVEGQHTNTVIASGEYDGEMTTDTAVAYFFSGDLPMVDVEKFVSVDGGANWVKSTQVVTGDDVSFKFVTTNTGNVALTGLSLSDSEFGVPACNPPLPASLAPDGVFECVIGPFAASDAPHTNTITASADFEGQTVTATDTASYIPVSSEEELDAILVIQGPIEAINGNILIIFGMEIELAEGDPLLTVLGIGDILRVEGLLTDGGIIIIVGSANITIVEVQTFVFTLGVQVQPGGPLVVPAGCKLTGFGNNNIRLKCSNKGSRRSGR